MSQGLWEEKLEALWGALSEGQETVYLHTAASFVNTMKVVQISPNMRVHSGCITTQQNCHKPRQSMIS